MAKLNIVIVTQDDPFYIPVFFEEFFRIFDESEIKLCGILVQVPLGKKSLIDLARQMLNFYGPAGFLYMGTRFVIHKALNFVAVQLCGGKFPGRFSVWHVLRKNNAQVLDFTSANSKAFRDFIEQEQIDLLVSIAASQRIKKETLNAPRYGCLNIHNARLPKNRGMLPNFWSLYHYDTEPVSAVTVHMMNEELDDGAIVMQREFALDPKETLDQLIIRTKRENASVILEAISKFKEGVPELLPNNADEATYNSFPTAADVANFRNKGLRLL